MAVPRTNDPRYTIEEFIGRFGLDIDVSPDRAAHEAWMDRKEEQLGIAPAGDRTRHVAILDLWLNHLAAGDVIC